MKPLKELIESQAEEFANSASTDLAETNDEQSIYKNGVERGFNRGGGWVLEELSKSAGEAIPRLAEIKESLDDGWFCDNPNGTDIKEEIQFLLALVSMQRLQIEELEGKLCGS